MATEGASPQPSCPSVDVTFFVPCLNEEKNVAGTLDVITGATAEVGVRYEILVVDDCSADGTVAVVEAYQANHPEAPIRLHKKERNQGLGRNYAEGARIARGRYYMLVNGDNVERREVLVALLPMLGQADILIPYFGRLDTRPWIRRIISRTFTKIVNWASGTSVRYYNGAVVHLRENVIKWHPGTRGFAYQAELITRLLAHGASYIEVEVPGEERQGGVSKAFRPKNMVSVGNSILRIARRRLCPDASAHRESAG